MNKIYIDKNNEDEYSEGITELCYVQRSSET